MTSSRDVTFKKEAEVYIMCDISPIENDRLQDRWLLQLSVGLQMCLILIVECQLYDWKLMKNQQFFFKCVNKLCVEFT